MIAIVLPTVVIDTTTWSIHAILALHGLLGLIIGSFLSMLSYRVIQHLDSDTPQLMRALIRDRSRCTHCQRPLDITQLIPIISWLWSKGKAACCAHPIPIRYLTIELATATLSVITAWHFYQAQAPYLGLNGQGWAALVLLWALITMSITDIEHQLIPDRLTLPLLWLGLLINTSHYGFSTLSNAVWGAALGYTCLWLLFQLHRHLTGKEGMGYGDFKLTAAIGAWLGVYALVPVFIIAGGLAMIMMGSMILLGKRDAASTFPFGPWLAIAGWLVVIGVSPI